MRSLRLAIFAFAALAQQPDERDLRARIAAYSRAWQQAQYEELWKLSSPKHHAGNDNDRRKFIRYIQRHNPVPVGLVLDQIKVEAGVAEAIVTTSYRFRHNNEILTDRECHRWIRVRGKWYCDTSRSLSPDAVVAPGLPPPRPCLAI